MTIPEELVERVEEALHDAAPPYVQRTLDRDARAAMARAVLEAVYTPLPKYEQVGWYVPETGAFYETPQHEGQALFIEIPGAE